MNTTNNTHRPDKTTRQYRKLGRHGQAVARLAAISLWRRIRLLESPAARRALAFVE